MTTISFHDPKTCEAVTLDVSGRKVGMLKMSDAHGSRLDVFVPVRVAEAMAAAWQSATDDLAHRAATAAQNAREMNAALPADQWDVMHAKGMI
jgi:hypothetical protein